MHFNFRLIFLLCIFTVTAHAQDNRAPSRKIGDPAPPLRVGGWLKGTPVEQFEKGKVYVLEFWATWCRPCIAAMPHLSTLARQYKDKVTVIGMDIYEAEVKPVKSISQVKAFVDSIGSRMDYAVAVEDSNFTVADWIEATGEKNNGIPRTFVVNGEGRLAWIGHPKELAEVLPKIVNRTWDIKEASTKSSENKRLRELDIEANNILMDYKGHRLKPGSVDRPDSALLVIDEMVRKEPGLKYAPFVAANTFAFLLQTDPQKAYQYGKEVLVSHSYEAPATFAIINTIYWYADKLNLPAQIFELGGEAYQEDIDQTVYPELVDMSKLYKSMADMYWRANNKAKAIEAQQQAIEALKGKHIAEVAEFESRLQQYKNM